MQDDEIKGVPEEETPVEVPVVEEPEEEKPEMAQ